MELPMKHTITVIAAWLLWLSLWFIFLYFIMP